MSINWRDLRTWDGSQQFAFEELCCQLAAYEPPSSTDTRFIRKGAPDAGVECYWLSLTGKEYAWQAKFFTQRPDDAQWRQLDESVKTALEKHPNLVEYTVCLPIDRADPRIEDANGRREKWFMDKWDERVLRWTAWATARSMSVAFRYWGEHEIFERLSREEHQGRHYFWFRSEIFSDSWFERRLSEAIADAGERYTPKLNVELPIARLFDGLGRIPEFFQRIKFLYGAIRRSYNDATPVHISCQAPIEYAALHEPMAELLTLLNDIREDAFTPIAFHRMGDLVSNAQDRTFAYKDALTRLDEMQKTATTSDTEGSNELSNREQFVWARHSMSLCNQEIGKLADFVSSAEARLANIPALLVRGEAGNGKTHLFCDIAQSRIDRGAPTLLILGQHLNEASPWPQILGLLNLSCTPEDFLGALDAAGEARKTKTLLMIDALNEGKGRLIWSPYLAGFLNIIKNYRWVSIAMSVRTSYEEVVVPTHIGEENIIRETHFGFAKHEYEAVRIFFAEYGIVRPSVPLLTPEFRNPLFLKLFCQGLKNRGLHEIPRGFHGITAVFDNLINSANKRLSDERFLNYDPASPIVKNALHAVAGKMTENEVQWLPRSVATELVNSLLPSTGGYQNSLFRHLLSEGLLAEDYMYVGKDDADQYMSEDVVRFTYERLADHLIVNNLLNKYLDPIAPEIAFAESTPLHALLKNEWACSVNKGVIEALSIQLPEILGKELTEVAPHIADFRSVRMSFIQSLIWRSLTAFTDSTRRYINDQVFRWKDSQSEFYDALLTVTATPGHPYNANLLHDHLLPLTLADRDSLWTIFLNEQHEERKAVDRLLEWGRSEEDKSYVSDEAMALVATALAWFLTSSNRFVRDHATKALVALLQTRISLVYSLIERFLGVNDLYVLERLYAVAYGCVLRSTNTTEIQRLGAAVYRWVFEDERPIPHILLRDYARGVVEAALHRGGMIPEVVVERIRPPYVSEWPAMFPTEEEIKHWGERNTQEQPLPGDIAREDLFSSIMGFADFSRYIIGTNSGSFFWNRFPLTSPRILTHREQRDEFRASLMPRQLRAFERFEAAQRNRMFKYLDDHNEPIEIDGHIFTREELDVIEKHILEKAESSFRKTLGKAKTVIYEKLYISAADVWRNDEQEFDLQLAQRWMVQRVFEMGWTSERFGWFDRYINHNRYDRSPKKPERIGKKYQWLAWHEFLALAADNLQVGRQFSNEDKEYIGPWQLSRRDIDPSCLLTETQSDRPNIAPPAWWLPLKFEAWNKQVDNLEWLSDSANLPDVEQMLDLLNQGNGSHWLPMDIFVKWEEPVPPEENRHRVDRRELWYMLKAYFVKREHSDAFFVWASNQDFMGRWMPESTSVHEVFLGEVYWSPAYEYYHREYYHIAEWHDIEGRGAPGEVRVPVLEYTAEGSDYDCSVKEGFTLALPAKWLADEMHLSWGGKDGEFFDNQGRLIAFDPSVKAAGPSTLLVQREALTEFLRLNDYDIFWTVLGEKQIIRSDYSGHPKGWLNISGAYRLVGEKFDGKVTCTIKTHA